MSRQFIYLPHEIISGTFLVLNKIDKEGYVKFILVIHQNLTIIIFLLYFLKILKITSFLTKKWNDCDEPILHENLGMGKGDHGDPDSAYHVDKDYEQKHT